MSLIIEFMIISILFYEIGLLSNNSIVTVGIMIIFEIIFTQFFVIDSSFVLFHVAKLSVDLKHKYWIIQSCIGIIFMIDGKYCEKQQK